MKKYYSTIILCMFLFNSYHTAAQDTLLNKYGLWVISSGTTFEKTILNNSNKRMVDISTAIPGILLDLKYAGKDNFMHEPLYPPIHTTYLREAASIALYAVQAELKTKGFELKIWDAYRPYSVTEKMWEPVKDDRYAADPKFGSGHNRGIAVDLTVVDSKTKKEMDMGTGFDNFSDTAHRDYKNLPEKVLQNRSLLRYTMEKHGFIALETEWWHYYLPDAKTYELLDLSFKTLRKIVKQFIK